MRNILLSAALLYACSSGAQKISGGFLTGASAWSDRGTGTSLFCPDNRTVTWNKGIFARMETRSRWAVSAGLSHDRFSRSVQTNTFNRRETTNYYAIPLTAQYDISCPHLMKSCPVLKNIRVYGGINITPVLERQASRYLISRGEYAYTVNGDDQTLRLWTGLSKTVVYSLCDHLDLISMVNLEIDPERFFSNSGSGGTFRPDSRLSLQAGAAYKFK